MRAMLAEGRIRPIEIEKEVRIQPDHYIDHGTGLSYLA
jgi:hypothetical protein